MLTIFFCTGVTTSVNNKVNSHVMLFNFQYILKNSCTLYLRCQISI